MILVKSRNYYLTLVLSKSIYFERVDKKYLHCILGWKNHRYEKLSEQLHAL